MALVMTFGSFVVARQWEDLVLAGVAVTDMVGLGPVGGDDG